MPSGSEGPTIAQRTRVQPPAVSHTDVSQTVSPELIAEASWRLGWLGLIYSAGALVRYFGRRALHAWSGLGATGADVADLFALLGSLLGLVMYVVSRRSLVSPKRLLDLGLAFEVAGAFGIATSQFWTDARLPDPSYTLVPAECVWIVSYPLVVPNTPRKVLIASLLAATMGPLVHAISTALNGVPLTTPLAIVSYFLPNYVVAIAAYAEARIVHRFNVRLKHAREIGSYELMNRIGEGGMGEVWRARHRLLARPAAIKLIRTDLLAPNPRAREAMVQRFEREARDTATLGSTHTIDVYDFGVTEDGAFYYVMELLDGISLERFVELFGPMEPARVVYLLRQVCHSLGEAHERGLVHRDIKPANIFMCRLGPDDDFVKVLDFGLVKHVDPPGGPLLTIEDTTAGTPAFMPPEVALGRPLDGRADIYSLGCVAYYLLTGEPVFEADSTVATILKHINERPIAPSLRSELEIPAALDELILQCLEKDPAARPASASLLERRFAETVSADSWTPEAAHTWWQLHHADLAHVEVTATSNEAATSLPRIRCWPRFDRKATEGRVA